MDKILFDGRGSHNHYQVVKRDYHGRPALLLLSGRAAPQSGLALDDDPELLFDYNQRFLEVALSLKPKSILIIGGGAFTLPKALTEYLPSSKIDVVEIDSLLPQLAQDYFHLPTSSNLTLITSDGRSYINNYPSSYDLIIVDAFDEFYIPLSLISTEAAAQYARTLSPRGVLAFNLITTYYGQRVSLAHKMIATFRQSFNSTEIYPADPYFGPQAEQNLIFVASKSDSPDLDYLQSSVVQTSFEPADHLRMSDADL